MRRFAIVCLLLGACGGDDSGGPIPIDELQSAFVNTFCNYYVSCGLIEDQTICRSLYLDLEIDASLIAAVEAGKVSYDEAKARECLASLGASCERGAASLTAEACDQTFTGTIAAGGQCAIDEECISQDCDVPTCPDACCQGTCVGDAPVPRPHVGESCATNSRCIDSYCDVTTTTCMPHKAVGAECTSTSQCGQNVCANQICTARPGPGEPCSSTTVGGQCSLLGYTCSSTSMTCVPLGLGGDPCTASSDCSGVYACGPEGTCVLRPRLGDACNEQLGGCIDHSYCEPSTLTCTAPKANGATCAGDRECQSGYCDSDVTATCMTELVCI